MKFREILRFELIYQARSAWTWVLCAVMLIFSFLMTRNGALAEALFDDFFINSSFAVAKTTVTSGLLWLLLSAVIAGEAAARDVARRMHPLVYTLPVARAEYLGGRFVAAYVVNAFLLLVVQIGIVLAVYLPGVDAALIGPFRLEVFLTAYAFLALPTAFVATAVQFLLASRSGRPMAAYGASLLLFFMAYVVATFLFFGGQRDLANLLDPIGVHFILSELSHLWTTTEKSTRLLALEGVVLANRLLWVAVGLVALAVTYFGFRFTHVARRSWWRSARRSPPGAPATVAEKVAARPVSAGLSAPVTFGFAFHVRQTLAVAWTSFCTLVRSGAGLALLVAVPLMAVLVVADQMEANGVPLEATTVRVLAELTAPLSAELSRWVIVPLLIVFFAGELIWRERDARLSEISDALPGSEWAPLLGKVLGLGLVLTLFTALLTASGMFAQTMLGSRDVQVGLYLTVMFGLQLPEYLLFAVLAIVVHVLVHQKYVGHLVAVLAWVGVAMASLFGVEHDLLIYGAGPKWSYTEMSGFGATLGPWIWFKLYWAAWALLLAVTAKLLWVRGRERNVRTRLQGARRRLTPGTVRTGAAALTLVLTLGGFIFYNTNVLNPYLGTAATKARAAEYERRYARYADAPHPQLTATTLRVDVHPERRAVNIRGTYRLVNRDAVPIRVVHVATASGVRTGPLTLSRPTSGVRTDETLGHRVYTLKTPLRPGESLRLDFEVRAAPRGFGERGVDPSIVGNGTSFTSGWLPAIGYQPRRELLTAGDRRRHGLAPRRVIASLYDTAATKRRSSGATVDTVISTTAAQVAVAPGALRRTWTDGGRRFFQYSTDGPIGSEYALFSAEYAVREALWRSPAGVSAQTVAIRIHHHPEHTAHLDRMVRSVRASLDEYTRRFGPYRSGHLSVVERPGNGTGMHAEAGMITHAEGFTQWRPEQEPGSLDLPFAIMAHEMAHQWTVPYASVEGAPVMSESVAWYYGMRAVERAGGPQELRRLLTFMRQPQPYPPIRRGEPLLRGLDPYLSYRKGPFALYTLSELVGEERIDAALRRLLETHRRPDAPLATTLDLYRELRAVTPATWRPLLHDLFEVNTSWDLRTERAVARRTDAGTWQVTLNVRAKKVVTDEEGTETDVPMNDLVQIGVFAGNDGSPDEPLYLRLHRVREGAQTITVTVPRRPARAGIDPDQLLMDPQGEDNVIAVRAGN